MRGFRFQLEVDGKEAGEFSEVIGADLSSDVPEYRTGDRVQLPLKMPGLKKQENVVLKNGWLVPGLLEDWMMDGTGKPAKKKTIRIILLDEKEHAAVSWRTENARPVKFSGQGLETTAPQTAIERLELVHDGIKREA